MMETQNDLLETDVEHRGDRALGVAALVLLLLGKLRVLFVALELLRPFVARLVSSVSMAFLKPLIAPPRSLPIDFRRFVPKISTTISSTIANCQMLIPPSPMF